MKRFLVSAVILVAALSLFSGCAKETKWVDTEAMVSTFCAGSIYVEGTKKTDPATYGVYLETAGDNVDLYFVDMASYVPGEEFKPEKDKKNKKDKEEKEESEEEGASEEEEVKIPEYTTINTTVDAVQDAIDTEDGMEEFFKEAFATIADVKSVNECDVKYTDATICTRLNGAYSCTANLVCDGVGISVHYIFKPFDEECPDSALMKQELNKSFEPIAEEPKKDETKKEEKKKDNKQKDNKQNTKPVTTPVENPNQNSGGYNSEVE